MFAPGWVNVAPCFDYPPSPNFKNYYMIMSILRRAAWVAVLAVTGISANAQDLIARQAPIDRRLRAVDSVTIQRAVDRDLQTDYSSNLYSSWVTNRAHPYKSSEVPDSFRIDLRGFCMPTPSRNVTSRFGYRPAFKRVHKGLDIKVYTGDTIVAAFDGKVRVVNYDEGGYGYYVVIRHHNGLETIYGHLSKQLVEGDQIVKAGEPIGLGGNTGRSFGSHLHFETRLAGEAINPELLFNFPAQDVTCDFYTFHKGDGGNASAVLAANDPHGATHFYKVKRGETLSSVATKLDMTEEQLARTNRLSVGTKLRTGQILRY